MTPGSFAFRTLVASNIKLFPLGIFLLLFLDDAQMTCAILYVE